MGRVIRTFITAGGYRGEGDLDVSAKVAHSGEGEAAGARMPPWPHLSDAAVHRAKQGRNCWSGQWQRKMALLCQRHIKIQQAAESPWQCTFFFLPFGPWAAKSGCGRQPAKRVWLPTASQTLCLLHPWVGEINFAGQAGNGVTGALRTARGSTLGLSCISRIFRRAIFHKDANNGPNPAYTCWEGQGRPPSQHRATQRPTGANGSEIARDAMIEKKRILLCHSISKPGRPQGPCRISPWNCGQRIIWWLTCICLLINQLCCGMTINSIFRFWVLLPEGTGHVPGAFWRL